jgi:hypothetical protein
MKMDNFAKQRDGMIVVSGRIWGVVFWGLLLILSAVNVYAESLCRTIEPDAAGEYLLVTLTWEFGESPDSCLVIQEWTPAGWEVFGVHSASHKTYSRPHSAAWQVAIGVGVLTPKNGSITYRMRPSPDMRGTYNVEGKGVFMIGTKVSNLIVRGDSHWEWPIISDPAGEFIKLIDLSIQQTAAPVSKKNNATASSSGYLSFMGDASGRILAIDFSPTLLDSDSWRPIHFSQPVDRHDSPYVISIPELPGPGFYRLRVVGEAGGEGL